MRRSFSVPLVTAGESSLDELQCRMDRLYSRAADGTAVVNSKLSALWHGEVTKQSFSRAASSQVVTVPLVKNTNTIRIILQQMDGVTVEVDKFEFTITDDNGLMNYDNKLLEDETLTYYPITVCRVHGYGNTCRWRCRGQQYQRSYCTDYRRASGG